MGLLRKTRTSGAFGGKAPLRLRVLATILGLCVLGYGAHWIRVQHYERQLVEIANGLVDEANREDPLPMPEAGPEADVEIQVMCRFEYLVVGKPHGRINLILHPRAYAPETGLSGIEYLYVRENGAWRQTDSYHM